MARIRNGYLLAMAEAEGFDLMVTCDQNLSCQQNFRNRNLALVILSTNNWNVLKNALVPIRIVVEGATPGSFQRVDLPKLN